MHSFTHQGVKLQAELRTGRAIVAILTLLGGLIGFGLTQPAPASASPLASMPAPYVSLPPGEQASFQVRAIALGPAGSLPGTGAAVGNLAAQSVRGALFYAVNWGYADSGPQQVYDAMSFAQSGVWPDTLDHTIANRILSAAAGNPNPSWLTQGTSVLTARQAALVRIGPAALTAGTAPHFGQGTIQVTNLGSNTELLYLPYGTLVSDGSNLAMVWATGVSAPVPVGGETATSTPTSTPNAKAPSSTPPPLTPPPTATSVNTPLPATPPPAKPPRPSAPTATPTETATPSPEAQAPATPTTGAKMPPPTARAMPPPLPPTSQPATATPRPATPVARPASNNAAHAGTSQPALPAAARVANVAPPLLPTSTPRGLPPPQATAGPGGVPPPQATGGPRGVPTGGPAPIPTGGPRTLPTSSPIGPRGMPSGTPTPTTTGTPTPPGLPPLPVVPTATPGAPHTADVRPTATSQTASLPPPAQTAFAAATGKQTASPSTVGSADLPPLKPPVQPPTPIVLGPPTGGVTGANDTGTTSPSPGSSPPTAQPITGHPSDLPSTLFLAGTLALALGLSMRAVAWKRRRVAEQG